MRYRAWAMGCIVVVGAVMFWVIEPRLDQRLPSMVDDWSAILESPNQLEEVLRLENPEEQRYRPGFVIWNALQWHTLGAPERLTGPQLWGIARVLVLVLGVTLLAALLAVRGPPRRIRGLDMRWLLVAGVPLAVITIPPIAIDLARFGPQEPLMVGCMTLGAVLLVRCASSLLEPDPPSFSTIAAAVGGLALWWAGVLQKETTLSVLLLAPFLWPTIRGQRARWAGLARERRVVLGGLAGLVLLPFFPILVRTVQLALAEDRVYEDASAGRSMVRRIWDQLDQAGGLLDTRVPAILLLVALTLLAFRVGRTGIDWLPVGLLVVASAFVVFAAGTGIVATRYYLPSLVLVALAMARLATSVGTAAVVVCGVFMLGAGLVQAPDARDWVEWWVESERDHELIVREAAARAAGGCDVDAIGLNVELVRALPVLMPLADEPARDCEPGERFVVVLDAGAPGTETPPDDPVLVACAPAAEPAWSSHLAKILRCTA